MGTVLTGPTLTKVQECWMAKNALATWITKTTPTIGQLAVYQTSQLTSTSSNIFAFLFFNLLLPMTYAK